MAQAATCEATQVELLDVAAVGEQPSGKLGDHLARCSACGEAWEDLSLSMGALGTLAPCPVPERVARDVLRAVSVEQTRMGGGLRLGLALLFGAAAASASLGLLAGGARLTEQPLWGLLVGGLAWLASFVVAFWILLDRRPVKGSWRSSLLIGLMAMAVFMVADTLLPLTEVIGYCETNSWMTNLLGSLGLRGAFFVFGSAYALIPLLMLSIATGEARPGSVVRGGLYAGAMFSFLVAPAIFLQCASFTAGALFFWLGGAVVGSVAGGVFGIWVRRAVIVSRR